MSPVELAKGTAPQEFFGYRGSPPVELQILLVQGAPPVELATPAANQLLAG